MLLKQHFFIYLLAFLFVFTACKDDKKVITQTKVTFSKEADLSIIKSTDSSKITLDIEIADTDFDRQTGLMYRDSMEDNQGMLFVFPGEQERFFYMKNTKIALDLLYIDANKNIVSFQENAKPFDESSLPSNAPAKYVLEINAGLANQWEISIGDRVYFNELKP